MNDTVSNDRDKHAVTEHDMTFEVDPELEADIVAMPAGLYLRLDAEPTRVGLAVLAHLRTARRIALDEAKENQS